MKFGIIGYGHMGRIHAKELLNLGIREIYVYDIREDALRMAKEVGLFICNSLEDILRNSDVMVVSTPTQTHYKILKRILEISEDIDKKVDILCEKPVTDSIERYEDIYKGVKGKNIRLFANYECMNPTITYAKDVGISEEGIWRLRIFSRGGRDNDFIRDIGSHVIAILLYFFGEGEILNKERWERGMKFDYLGKDFRVEVEFGFSDEVIREITSKKCIFDLKNCKLVYPSGEVSFGYKTVYNLWKRFLLMRWIPEKDFILKVWRKISLLY